MRYNLFPTPLWHIEGAPLELIDELYQGAYRFKKKYPSTQMTNCGGYQSPAFSWDQFHPDGIEYLNKILSDVFKPTPLSKYDGRYSIQNWWYNINSKGNSNMPHVHPATDCALVFYLTDSDNKLVLVNSVQRLSVILVI